ncbi:hypothetical protein M9H77_02792 [Catharanthus roseus]|uniref:Uncharacterized protein n=1 Tax=Catharanthus roseus TaxID=4058 RepID=A0ACC0C9J5_CATRO|nr:hypothetical protein M9H77_02792 [Catharanthus roseus]
MKIFYKRLEHKKKTDLTTPGILLHRLTVPLFVLSQSGKKHDIEIRERERSLSPPGLYGQSLDPRNEAIGNMFRHLVVNTSRTPYEFSISITIALSQSLPKPGYRFLGHLQDPP